MPKGVMWRHEDLWGALGYGRNTAANAGGPPESPAVHVENVVARYQLKTPYRDGTTHVIFEPLDFIARLAALVPKPRVNLTRFHGVFAPNSKHRARVTPGKRGKGNKRRSEQGTEEHTPAERRASMSWAQRLKRVFGIDIETCRELRRRRQDYRLH